jgi:cytidyltransferase-like protein
MKAVVISANFERLDSAEFRLLEEAARLGELHVLLWSDAAIRARTGREPAYPEKEREYVIKAVRYVSRVHVSDLEAGVDGPPGTLAFRPDIWAVGPGDDRPAKEAFCKEAGLQYKVISRGELDGFPELPPAPPSGGKKVVVTGCYDFFHSGHVRFFEEVAALGDLFVVVGNDENVRLLKGPGHPLLTAAERRFAVGAIRHVRQALISTGTGWMDAEPEIAWIKPDFYVVNEDGDKPEKREFCKTHGIEYVVLKRVPKEGLARRSSTDLRGF